MLHEAVGVVTIGSTVTTIRKYENGMYGVEADGKVVYSGATLEELTDKLDENNLKYSIK
ncbi:hypothetical protein [Pseudoalteromonas sp. G4]|uniref:hypothetical protein n=1 Tax=Pseudoalteromonas sp. G4 TaxID=2992761 RepID=UPI00237D5A45|nr:hypothetical protein [Pseudoalteromonas sp. G4]MDE3270846.1 hypothetical protein [Pseudoalteromonas sp. G4]